MLGVTWVPVVVLPVRQLLDGTPISQGTVTVRIIGGWYRNEVEGAKL